MDKLEHARLTKRILRRKKKVVPVVNALSTWDLIKYDRMGDIIDYEVWAKLVNEPDYYIIEADQLENVTISTTWLGINALKTQPVDIIVGSHTAASPMIFDTEIKDSFNIVRYKYYYPTETVALKHHFKLVFMADQKMFKELG